MLFDKTLKKKVSSSVEVCSSLGSRMKGLMFSRSSRVNDNSLVFVFSKKFKWDLHMFFVFFPIDIVYLDENRKVVEMKKHLGPFTMYFPREESLYVVEMQAGLIDSVGVDIGHELRWKDGS